MKITITGSLGNIGKPLATELIQAGHTITIVTSSAEKSAAIEALGATPAVGSIEDVAFLTNVFTGADAIFTMVPPHFGAADWKGYIAGIGRKYAEAIKNSGVKYVVNLSSIGAHMPTGAGPVSGIHFVEQSLNALEGVNVLHVRPAFFYTNFYANVDMIKNMGIIGGNNPGSTRQLLVHPNDIAHTIADALIHRSFTGKSVQYIVSDIRSSNEIAAVIGTAVGKPGLPWVEFTDEQSKQGMLQAGLPEEIASNYVEMGIAMRTGKMFEDFHGTANGIKLEAFAKEFAAGSGLAN